jgi:hypothetical protein
MQGEGKVKDRWYKGKSRIFQKNKILTEKNIWRKLRRFGQVRKVRRDMGPLPNIGVLNIAYNAPIFLFAHSGLQ